MRTGAAAIGLLYFNHDEPGKLSTEMVEMLERMAANLAARLSQRLASAAYEESEDRYRRLLANAPGYICRMSLPDGRYEYVSVGVFETTGYTQKEFMETPLLIRDIVHRDGSTRWLTQRNIACEMRQEN